MYVIFIGSLIARQNSFNEVSLNLYKISEGEEIQLYPWESEICMDYDEEACAVFKPMCNLMGVISHKKCRKTCKLCIQDKPKPRSKI